MKDFFSIISRESDDSGRHVYSVLINPQHDIFNGHFPGKPVVPGVMTLFILRRCAEDAANLGNTRIAYVKDAKYFAPIIPDGKPITVAFSVADDLALQAEVKGQDGTDFTKIRATLTPLNA